MHRHARLSLTLLAFLLAACDRPPTEPAPGRPSAVIRDGTHAGNPDFFFLAPLVPSPVNDPQFEAGDVNYDVASSITVRICELNSDNLLNGLPTATTTCRAVVKEFAPGTVALVKDPAVEGSWWRAFSPPADGFYYVRWDTRQSDLDVTKYYRIHVLLAGVELGIADVDPMNGLREAKNIATGSVIPIIDNVWLPIMFRIEHGALCENPAGCVEKTITNDNPDGDYQVVAAQDAGGQTIAGGIFPDGWLPTGLNPDGSPRPTSVVVRIERVDMGTPDENGVFPQPCHVGTPSAPFAHQQFNGCFHFSTFPELQPIDATGRTFAVDVTGVVCIEISREDPRFHFLQLWASDPTETPVEAPHALKSTEVPENFLQNDDCEGVYSALRPSGRFALVSDGLRKLAKGFGRVFGVKEANAVDLGLGGLMPDFSNVSPVLTAELRRVTTETQTLPGGSTILASARVLGTHLHDGTPLSEGLPGTLVTFTVPEGNGTIERIMGTPLEEDTPTQIVVTSASDPIDDGEPPAGYASVEWTLPTAPGTYTLVATGQASGEIAGNAVTFTATVPDLGHIIGTVWSGDGNTRTLPGAIIERLGPDNETVLETDIANDVTSTFRFRDLAAGVHRIRASSPNHDSRSLSVTVVAGEETVVEFHLPPHPATLSGTIRDLNTGLPIPGARVFVVVDDRVAFTDEAGFYSIGSITPRTETINISAAGYVTRDIVANFGPGGQLDGNFLLTPLPSLALSPAAPTVVSAVAGGSTVQQTLAIANSGGGTLEGVALQFTYPTVLVCDTCQPPRMVSVALNTDVAPGQVVITADVDETIPPGDYAFSFTVTATNAANGSIVRPFIVRVLAPGTIPVIGVGGDTGCGITVQCIPPT